MADEFAGTLREYIRIERTLPARDGLGAASAETAMVGEFWAAVDAQNTGVISAAESHIAMPKWRFLLRQTDQILPGDRLTWGGRIMTVRTVSEDRKLLPKTIVEAEEIR